MTKIELLKQAYNLAKSIKVDNIFVCPSCGTSEIKKHYNQAFCKSKGKTKCKDYYWNNVDFSFDGTYFLIITNDNYCNVS